MSNRISKQHIYQSFVEALEPSIRDHSTLDETPLEVELEPPLPPKIRTYGYRVSSPPSSGANTTYSAHLILPDQGSAERGTFDHSDGYFVLLLGYAPDPDVYILWDAGLHQHFRYAKQVQVKASTIFEAVGGNIGTQERHLQTGTETVLTANANNLPKAIERRHELTTERLTN
jgi:hypothetical protein